jgi:WD40 repeat protein
LIEFGESELARFFWISVRSAPVKHLAPLFLAFWGSMCAQIANAPPSHVTSALRLQFVKSWIYDDPGEIRSADISPNGRWIAAGIDGHSIKVWQNGSLAWVGASSEYEPTVNFSFDGRLLLSTGGPSASSSATLMTVRDTTTGDLIGTISANERWKSIFKFVLSPNSSMMAMSNWEPASADPNWLPDEDIAWVDLSAAPFRQVGYPTPKRWGARLKFTADSRFLAIWGARDRGAEKTLHDAVGNPYKEVVYQRTVRLWNVTTNQPGMIFTTPCEVTSVAFSKNLRWMATACQEELVRHDPPTTSAVIIIWDMLSGQKIRALTGHEANVYTVAFSPDDRLLATGSTKIMMWETTKWNLAWQGDPCAYPSSPSWHANLTWTASGEYLLANCLHSLMLLRRVGELPVPPGPAIH